MYAASNIVNGAHVPTQSSAGNAGGSTVNPSQHRVAGLIDGGRDTEDDHEERSH